MRILFVGAERVGEAALRYLLTSDRNVVGVVTASAKMKRRVADWVPFNWPDLQRRPYFDDHDPMRVWEVDSFPSVPWSEVLGTVKPDLVLVISWSGIIPNDVLAYPKLGCIGFHYSLLPERPGAAPLNWAIIDGLEETGVTMLYLVDKVDAGDVLDQRPIPIEPDDTPNELLAKIAPQVQGMLAIQLPKIEDGSALAMPQAFRRREMTKVRTPSDGEIHQHCWATWEPETLRNFIRAQDKPYPQAYVDLGRFRLRFTKVRQAGSGLVAEVEIGRKP